MRNMEVGADRIDVQITLIMDMVGGIVKNRCAFGRESVKKDSETSQPRYPEH